MKVTAMVHDKDKPDQVYLAENDIVLKDPPITLKVSTLKNLVSINHFRHAGFCWAHSNNLLKSSNVCVPGSQENQTAPRNQWKIDFQEPGKRDADGMHTDSVWKWNI